MNRSIPAVLSALVAAAACSDVTLPPAGAAPQSGFEMPGGGVTITVTQRTTTPLGADGAVRLTVDDVTRGQVLTSISKREGMPLLAPIAMRPGESSVFRVDGRPFRVTLHTLQNHVFGPDHAMFTVSDPSAGTLPSEEAKIQLLIDRLKEQEDVHLIGDGRVYEGKEAAARLQSIWNYAMAWSGPARTFIDSVVRHCGSTRGPCRIRYADGTEVDARAYFEAELERIEAGEAVRPVPDAAVRPHLDVPGGGFTVTVEQRTTSPLRGSDGTMRLTLDDVTGWQVLTCISTADGAAILHPTSMRPGDSSTFRVDGRPFRLTLHTLRNRLIGTDHAMFTVSDPSAGTAPTEEAKIQLLIDRLREMKDARFIRNGSEYDGQKAAAHLQVKWSQTTGRIGSASEFIDRMASRSLTTGEPYRIRYADGTEVDARTHFEAELEKIESGIVR